MTGAALPFVALAAPAARGRQLALTAASWTVAAGIWTAAPLLAFWAGSRVETSGNPSMTSLVVVIVTFATVSYALIVLLRALARARERLEATLDVDGTRLPWLYRPRQPPAISATAAIHPHAIAAARLADPAAAPSRQPLVLLDGGTGATRPWQTVTPHLEFGFDVLAGVLPRDGSLDGTFRAMDRVGWQTAHVVARPRDAGAAVDLARHGRARSLLILASDAVADDSVAVATEIAEFAAFRPPSA